jgi:hypothetical protein
MQFKIRGALAAAALSAAALAVAPAAQAQPTVCSTAGFKALDGTVNRNPRAFAGLLGLTYRFAPQPSAAGFDTLVQCDVTGAKSVFSALKVLNPSEASSFETYFTQHYRADASSVFGGGIILT